MYQFDPYAILGVARDADADDIKRVYRELMKKHHPDVSDDPGAVDRTVEITLAYQFLSDVEERRAFDENAEYVREAVERWLRSRWVEFCARCGRPLHWIADPDRPQGRRWIGRRTDTRYCSNACRQAAYRARKAEAAAMRRRLPGGRDDGGPKKLEP